MRFLGSKARQAAVDESYKNPAHCQVCGGLLSYQQHKKGCKTCGNTCGRAITAAAKVGRPNPHGPILPTTANWNGKTVALVVEPEPHYRF